MQIDSINNPNNEFNVYITKSLAGILDIFFDPFMILKPHKWPFIWEYRKVVRYLRRVGREQITARINAIKNNENLPNDILTTILNSHSICQKIFFIYIIIIMNYLNVKRR